MPQADRYARQAVLPEIGPGGQDAIAAARVVVVGVGAVGSASADLLARAGIGHLRLVDRDIVEPANLQRQTLYSEADVDRPKAEAAADRLERVNSQIQIEAVARDVHARSVHEVLRDADLIVDGTDNLETRHLLNEAALAAGIPFVYGGAVGTSGMVFAIQSPHTACFRCLNPKVPPPASLPTCETAGILNSVSTLVGAIQTAETLRLLVGERPSGQLLIVDGWRVEVQRVHVPRKANCPACVRGEREFLGAQHAQVLASVCGSETISLDPLGHAAVDLDAVGRRLEALGSVKRSGALLIADVEGHHLALFPDGRALIRGVKDAGGARSVYAKYVGI